MATEPTDPADGTQVSLDAGVKSSDVAAGPQAALSEAELIEERRRKREAIRAKHKVAADSVSPDASAPTDHCPSMHHPTVEGPSQVPQEPAANATNETVQEVKLIDDDVDMFAEGGPDEDHNMFAPEKPMISTGLKVEYDSEDGHYRIVVNEILHDRYKVVAQIGKGTFATVIRAIDLRTGGKVAIKIAGNNEKMQKAGLKEAGFLEILNDADSRNVKGVIRCHGHFMHKNHLCLIFDDMDCDLRSLLKKGSSDVGFNLDAVKVYARQLFHALDLMRQQHVIHADIKPDNILASYHPHNIVKLGDFGTALLAKDAMDPAPLLVSRYYRAPELILGMCPYDYSIDTWAIGCTLFELYTDQILFKGEDLHDMLRVIQICRGKITSRVLKRSEFGPDYFNRDMQFISEAGNPNSRPYVFPKSLNGPGSLQDRLQAGMPGDPNRYTNAERRLHKQFLDLLEKCLETDPERRITPVQALHHKFFDNSQAN